MAAPLPLPVGDAAIRLVEVLAAELLGVPRHRSDLALVDLDARARRGGASSASSRGACSGLGPAGGSSRGAGLAAGGSAMSNAAIPPIVFGYTRTHARLLAIPVGLSRPIPAVTR